MVTISCSGKFHAFALAEQMEKNNLLDSFYTTYAYQKNNFMKRLAKRIDKEEIPPNKIHTNLALAFPIKLNKSNAHVWNNLFDLWVASKLCKSKSKVFMGWSGMSLHSIRTAKKFGMKTIVERGSSHILFQNRILKEEYQRFGIDFSIHSSVIEKELKEYEESDYISIPSYFVKNSFIQEGIPEKKLFLNPYGATTSFISSIEPNKKNKFTILYLGTLSVRKGLIYMFEALSMLSMDKGTFDVWFIGSIDKELLEKINLFKKGNWTFWGHINHSDLRKYLVQCDVAVHPSIEEGLSMVIPQLMSCAIPVIATTNTGAGNIITDNINGYIIPIRTPELIAEKLAYLYNNPDVLSEMKHAAIETIKKGFTWDKYGRRYVDFLAEITSN